MARYQKRISGPLLDRIDIRVQLPVVEYEKLTSNVPLESSESIRARVEEAKARQRQRFQDTQLARNADMGPGEAREYFRLDDVGRSLRRSPYHLQMRSGVS